ncbi:uncharacterized protein [Onthophagus taurus]|uniref:uncharacterized protein isoform X2 n=1 Tax=Onthophagus taurus TaxID=166361 RepID=UPI000C20C879|nr:uncharacterized protein LOC111426413 isoform X2 [Onthophagus taurus]
MTEALEDLNYDFNYNLFLAKTMLTLLHNTTSCEMDAEIGVMNVQNGELRPPFLDNPPPGPLPPIAHMLPGGAEAMSGPDGKWTDASQLNEQKPLLYQHSPDGGAFLAAQPIPRCGAFCYLAVVSRSPKSP